jgi:hypothetical protein
MFWSLSNSPRTSTDEIDTLLSKASAVYNWTSLGIFTGSRIAEYDQTRLAKGVSYNIVPTTDDAGSWAGQPLAFVGDDFPFYDAAHTLIEHRELHRQHVQVHVQSVHIRFRFDKSPRNFSICKFQLTNYPIFWIPSLQLLAVFIGRIFFMFPSGNPLEFLVPSHGRTLSFENFTSRQS